MPEDHLETSLSALGQDLGQTLTRPALPAPAITKSLLSQLVETWHPDDTEETSHLLADLLAQAQGLANLLQAVTEERSVRREHEGEVPELIDATDWAWCHDLLAMLLDVSRTVVQRQGPRGVKAPPASA
jgi:hypothetical protein